MITVVIPARLGSSRFPGKPLQNILGLPLVEHVRRRSLLAKGIDLVAVATCDEPIKSAIEGFGGVAVMTKDSHERATERVAEAMQTLPGDIVVMVQGDEPLLIPQAINDAAEPLFQDDTLDVVNLLSPLESADDYANVNIVKAVCDLQGNVIFLTRAAVPTFRQPMEVPVYRQTGIMAFRTSFLPRFDAMSETPLEKAESIDMLRVLEHSVRIKGALVDYVTVGVDRPSDVALVESILRENKGQRALFEAISDGAPDE